ncbi:MAG: hypothetical protein OHK0024_19750 [Thalassobaculales bacterium]
MPPAATSLPRLMVRRAHHEAAGGTGFLVEAAPTLPFRLTLSPSSRARRGTKGEAAARAVVRLMVRRAHHEATGGTGFLVEAAPTLPFRLTLSPSKGEAAAPAVPLS